MPRFAYVALDSRGEEITGIASAASITDATAQLRQSGYFPTKIEDETVAKRSRQAAQLFANGAGAKPSGGQRNLVLFQRKSVKPKTLMIFSRQLATLIDAGLPLLRGLEVLAKQERDPVLKRAIN